MQKIFPQINFSLYFYLITINKEVLTMYDKVRKCLTLDAACGGALRKCNDCGGIYCGNCSGNGYGWMCPYCGSNESKSF